MRTNAEPFAATLHDALCYRALRKYLTVQRDKPGDWTCWLALDCIPYRSSTEDPDVLIDLLVANLRQPKDRP